MKLDVGCGNTPTGDMNIDFLGSERHRGGVKLAAKSIPNFICASAYALPFRDNFFDARAQKHNILPSPLGIWFWERVVFPTFIRVRKVYIFVYLGEI